jgi:hypothetical protein
MVLIDEEKFEQLLDGEFRYDMRQHLMDLLIQSKEESVPAETMAMQWQTKEDKPLPYKRIIIFSPCYPEESDMRKRIITGQFLELCTEATHWSYISEPSEMRQL